jgi:hypothetical protein
VPSFLREESSGATCSRTNKGDTPRHGEGGQRRRRTAAQRHTACCRPCPGPAPATARPATADPHNTSPANNNRTKARRISCRSQMMMMSFICSFRNKNEPKDIYPTSGYSTTCPSTVRCSKDVTTHHHQPGARPGRPCPVPDYSGQPLPGERRFISPLGNRFFLKVWDSDSRRSVRR